MLKFEILKPAKHYPKAIAEAEGAKLYITAVKDARLAIIGLIAFFIAVFSLVGGFALLLLAIVYKVAPDALSTAAIVMGGLMFLIPLVAFVVGLSQKVLLKITKIENLVAKVKDDTFAARTTSPAH